MSDGTVIMVSGGRDSALAAEIIRREEPETWEKALLLFCDSGYEHDETYDYLDALEAHWGRTIHRMPPPIDILEEAKRIGPPLMIRRWCTGKIKRDPQRRLIRNATDIIVGIRADEVARHASVRPPMRSPLIPRGIDLARLEALFDEYGLPRNPIYAMGLNRASCWLCPMSRKGDWLWLARHHPDRLRKLIEWERETGTPWLPGRRSIEAALRRWDALPPGIE
mgnify:CR=1 FL=1